MIFLGPIPAARARIASLGPRAMEAAVALGVAALLAGVSAALWSAGWRFCAGMIATVSIIAAGFAVDAGLEGRRARRAAEQWDRDGGAWCGFPRAAQDLYGDEAGHAREDGEREP